MSVCACVRACVCVCARVCIHECVRDACMLVVTFDRHFSQVVSLIDEQLKV